jgi:hypothetical protein
MTMLCNDNSINSAIPGLDPGMTELMENTKFSVYRIKS